MLGSFRKKKKGPTTLSGIEVGEKLTQMTARLERSKSSVALSVANLPPAQAEEETEEATEEEPEQTTEDKET